MNNNLKPSNPKDAVGSGKLPLGLVPQSGIAYEALAFMEGGLKYGAHNYRAIGVRASIYHDACLRHIMKWWNGQDEDPKTRIHHLGSARACLNVILDAGLMGKLTDDRPPSNEGLVRMIEEAETEVAHLKGLFKAHNPHHYTISDNGLHKKIGNGNEKS